MNALAEERHDFKIAVLALDQGCIVASADSPCEGEVQAHHVVTQRQLRGVGMEDWLWDPSNGAAVCERHHRRHHNRREPIPMLALPQRCLAFIDTFGLDPFLARFYT